MLSCAALTHRYICRDPETFLRMEDEALPEDVLRFIADRIDSVPHLEALLLLWESPKQRWSESEIAARVYVKGDIARRLLQDLAHRHLIAESGSLYVYNATWDDSNQLMPRVADTYRRHLIRIAKIIHSKASPGVQEFARAFQLKKED
jgi:hypothetical protein